MVTMARIRVPDRLRDEIKKYVRNNSEYDTQSEFVKDAIRRLFDEKNEVSDEEAVRQIIRDELDKRL